MLTPPLVLTNENCNVCRGIILLVAALSLGLLGCSPPGPRALLQGKELVEKGRHAEAVERLEQATTLLPTNALAWNYLGLAYHGNQQPEAAAKAYRAALALDHRLIAVRYNLGCLYLEENNLAAATDELKSYTLLQPSAVQGWLKLGGAQLRSRRLDDAEKSFRAAIELQVRNSEALNGLGLIQVQRRQWAEAINLFSVAARQDPPYPPAVLNCAVMYHQYFRNHPLALERYREYLALAPGATDRETVEAAVRELASELYPTAIAQAPAPRAATPRPRSVPADPRTTQIAAQSVPAVPSRPAAPPSQTAPPRAEIAPTTPPVRTPVVTPPSPPSQAVVVSKPPVASPRPVIRQPVPEHVEPAPPKAVEIEVSRVQSEVVVKAPQELTRSPAGTSNAVRPIEAAAVAESDSITSPKRSLLSRLNPFGGRPKSDPSSSADGSTVPPTAIAEGSRAAFARYNYLSPGPPSPGSRAEGEKAFRRGIDSYRDNNRTQAVREYRRAVESDPAYYEAYYNLGLAALEVGETRLSLWA
jgi:tetratricopeptide (TPR) repeat protein